MSLHMSIKSLTGSARTPNLSTKKMRKKGIKKFIPGQNWKKCSDVKEGIDLFIKLLRLQSIVNVLLKRPMKKLLN
jgi:hypothetical protein